MNLLKSYLPHYTVEDYKQWEGDWELIEGIPYAMTPSPVWKHQRIISVLVRQIEEQLESCPQNCYVCQEIDWIVKKDTVVRPDVIVVCGKVKAYVESPPEVIFEIVSESSVFKDENLKFRLYEMEKVKYYALVYPELEKMKVFKLKDNRYEEVFDGKNKTFTFNVKCKFSVNLDGLWRKI